MRAKRFRIRMARTGRSAFGHRKRVRRAKEPATEAPGYLYAILGAAVAATLAWCLLLVWGAFHLVEDLLL